MYIFCNCKLKNLEKKSQNTFEILVQFSELTHFNFFLKTYSFKRTSKIFTRSRKIFVFDKHVYCTKSNLGMSSSANSSSMRKSILILAFLDASRFDLLFKVDDILVEKYYERRKVSFFLIIYNVLFIAV